MLSALTGPMFHTRQRGRTGTRLGSYLFSLVCVRRLKEKEKRETLAGQAATAAPRELNPKVRL